jgi:hypothetical protein
MEQKETAMNGKNRIMIHGPMPDGTFVVEFRTAAGEVLAISIPSGETAVLEHFQNRMPHGLFGGTCKSSGRIFQTIRSSRATYAEKLYSWEAIAERLDRTASFVIPVAAASSKGEGVGASVCLFDRGNLLPPPGLEGRAGHHHRPRRSGERRIRRERSPQGLPAERDRCNTARVRTSRASRSKNAHERWRQGCENFATF